MTTVEWIEKNGSGTLKQAVACGMSYNEHYLHERLAMEVASAAEAVHPSRLTTGKYIAAPDDKTTTELGWYRRVLKYRWSKMGSEYSGAEPQVVYFTLEDSEGTRTEGAGYLVEGLDLPWIPQPRVVLIPLAYWDHSKKTWLLDNPL